MSTKLCRQVSIESPSLIGRPQRGLVLNGIVPVPETPATGARIKVVYAGACYRRPRSASLCSQTSAGAELTDSLFALKQAMLAEAAATGNSDSIPGGHPASIAATLSAGTVPAVATGPASPTVATAAAATAGSAQHGLRDGALFPGFEVAGVIDQLGDDVKANSGFSIGQRVCLYPFAEVPDGYAEYIVVPELRFLIAVPDELPLRIAAMLPTGALLAMNAVSAAHQIAAQLLAERQADATLRILIVGTGGLALWAVRIAMHHFALAQDQQTGDSLVAERVRLTVASLHDEGFALACNLPNVGVVQWNEDLYESQLIERTRDACGGPVDVVIDFGTTSRSLHRSLRCLSDGGVVLLSEDVAERLLPKFERLANEREQRIRAVRSGTVEQLEELVGLVASGRIRPPPHSVFPFEEAQEVVQRLCRSEIHGRAILKFHDIE